MRTRLIWSVTVPHDIETLRNACEAYLRDALRALASALEVLQRRKGTLEPRYERLRRNEWPVPATVDSHEFGGDFGESVFSRHGSNSSAIELIDAGRIELLKVGSSTTIEIHSYDQAANQHLIPIIALVRLLLAYLSFQSNPSSPRPLQIDPPPEAAELGMDLPDSSGTAMAASLLESLLAEVSQWNDEDSYGEMMADGGQDRVVDRSIKNLGLSASAKSRRIGSTHVRILVRAIGVLAIILSMIWFISEPSFEPAITGLGGLAALIGSFLGQGDFLGAG